MCRTQCSPVMGWMIGIMGLQDSQMLAAPLPLQLLSTRAS
jgi:hypothetical protein